MKLKLTTLLFLVLVIMACQSSSKEKGVEKTISETIKDLSPNEKWRQAINTNDVDLLETLYTEKALVLSRQGVDLSNRNEILELVKDSDFKVKSVKTIEIISASEIYNYEIGNFANKDGNLMKHLIIWKASNNKQLRELEFLAEVENVKVDLNLINVRRAKWMALCNAHDVKSLVKDMYAENTMYYNKERLLEGNENLIEEYQYMNNPSYSLGIEPILVEPVSSDLVFEFGQCKGSYNGKYLFVWEKNAEGIWKILFDSNI